MTLNLLLHELGRRGIALRLEGDRIRLRGAAGQVTESLAAMVRRHKPAIIAHLSGDSGPDLGQSPPHLGQSFRTEFSETVLSDCPTDSSLANETTSPGITLFSASLPRLCLVCLAGVSKPDALNPSEGALTYLPNQNQIGFRTVRTEFPQDIASRLHSAKSPNQPENDPERADSVCAESFSPLGGGILRHRGLSGLSVLTPVPAPDWKALSAQRWGPALPPGATGPCSILGADDTPDIDIVQPNPARRLAALHAMQDLAATSAAC
jgi:hypothetical protein